MWTQDQAIALCREIEAICPNYGCHVALTGGTLYKDGERKDVDLMFYRIRQVEEIDTYNLFDALLGLGIRKRTEHGWVWKCDHENGVIDFFFPEFKGNDYPEVVTANSSAEEEIVF